MEICGVCGISWLGACKRCWPRQFAEVVGSGLLGGVCDSVCEREGVWVGVCVCVSGC